MSKLFISFDGKRHKRRGLFTVKDFGNSRMEIEITKLKGRKKRIRAGNTTSRPRGC